MPSPPSHTAAERTAPRPGEAGAGAVITVRMSGRNRTGYYARLAAAPLLQPGEFLSVPEHNAHRSLWTFRVQPPPVPQEGSANV